MQKASNRRLLPALLLGGGGLFVVLLACGACGIGGYFLFFSRPPVAGEWALTNPSLGGGTTVTMEFRANGTGTIHAPTSDVAFEYSVSSGQPAILEWRITKTGQRAVRPHGQLEIRVNDVILVGGVTERFRIAIEGETLMLANQNGAAPFLLRRVR